MGRIIFRRNDDELDSTALGAAFELRWQRAARSTASLLQRRETSRANHNSFFARHKIFFLGGGDASTRVVVRLLAHHIGHRLCATTNALLTSVGFFESERKENVRRLISKCRDSKLRRWASTRGARKLVSVRLELSRQSDAVRPLHERLVVNRKRPATEVAAPNRKTAA